MVDISASAVTGSLRVGLQVVSNHKRPMLEIYHEVCNRMGPQQEFDVPSGVDRSETRKFKTRFQDIFIQFALANIGGVRAEDVDLQIEGTLKRHEPRGDFGGAFKTPIPQFGPGQVHFLFNFSDYDLWHYPDDVQSSDGARKPDGLKTGSFTITVSYNPPKGLINSPLIWLWSVFGKRKRYTTSYTFSTQLVAGDLPPIEYAA